MLLKGEKMYAHMNNKRKMKKIKIKKKIKREKRIKNTMTSMKLSGRAQTD
jgi:hypothetical protein